MKRGRPSAMGRKQTSDSTLSRMELGARRARNLNLTHGQLAAGANRCKLAGTLEHTTMFPHPVILGSRSR